MPASGEPESEKTSQQTIFAHPSEREFARILDFFGIRWLYEPRSFPLRWAGERATEMFTPDFYLPDLDLYIELTTMRQRLVTKKNRKVRLLRELYPDVKVMLLYRRDYLALLAKYGIGGPEMEALPVLDRLLEDTDHILYTSAQVQSRVQELGAQLARDYRDKYPLFVGVLRGVAFFMADLIRATPIHLGVDFLALSHYGSQHEDSPMRILKDLDQDIRGRHVVLVEDIVDTGFTLRYLLEVLRARGPASLRVCALVDKRVRRLVDVPLDYVGFEVGDQFVVGYGLDHRQKLRNLPFLAVLRPGA